MRVKLEIYDEKRKRHILKKAVCKWPEDLIDLIVELSREIVKEINYKTREKKPVENNRVDMDEDVESFLVDDEECYDEDFEDYLSFDDEFDEDFEGVEEEG